MPARGQGCTAVRANQERTPRWQEARSARTARSAGTRQRTTIRRAATAHRGGFSPPWARGGATCATKARCRKRACRTARTVPRVDFRSAALETVRYARTGDTAHFVPTRAPFVPRERTASRIPASALNVQLGAITKTVRHRCCLLPRRSSPLRRWAPLDCRACRYRRSPLHRSPRWRLLSCHRRCQPQRHRFWPVRSTRCRHPCRFRRRRISSRAGHASQASTAASARRSARIAARAPTALPTRGLAPVASRGG